MSHTVHAGVLTDQKLRNWVYLIIYFRFHNVLGNVAVLYYYFIYVHLGFLYFTAAMQVACVWEHDSTLINS